MRLVAGALQRADDLVDLCRAASVDEDGVAGARELLLQCGFEPWAELAADGSVLVLPVEAPLAKLREGQAQLLACAEASIAAAGGPKQRTCISRHAAMKESGLWLGRPTKANASA